MYIYSLLFCFSLVLALLSFYRKINDVTIAFVLISITALLCLRYGQGSDYFSYAYLIANNHTFAEALTNTPSNHGEIGFRIIAAMLHGNFRAFIILTSIYDMCMFAVFLWKHSKNKAFALFLFIPTILCTYCFSAIRQSIVLLTFLGVGISLIEEKKWIRYIAMCLVLSLIHSVALVLLAIPLLNYISLQAELLILLPGSLIVGIALSIPATGALLGSLSIIGSKLSYYLSNSSISIKIIMMRMVTLVIMMLFYYSWRRQAEHTESGDPWWIKAYVFGQILFFALMPFITIATRTYICFKVLEIMFVPNMIEGKNRYRQIVIVYFILLMAIVYRSNINSYISQGEYYSNINFVNYPYISVFNKTDLWNYRLPDKNIEYDYQPRKRMS